MITIISPKKDLYNAGKCFTAGKEYEVNKLIQTPASLMDVEIVNDQGQRHIIGSWWREFEIIENQ